jgi:hypothetical protein
MTWSVMTASFGGHHALGLFRAYYADEGRARASIEGGCDLFALIFSAT